MAQRNILVLERNEKIRNTIRAALVKSGFKYLELAGSENLFRYLNNNPIDVLLLNARQQGMGARSICSIVRNDPQYRRFPLIILYGKPGKTTRLDYLKQGADDFVEMPFSPVQLVDVVKARLRPVADRSEQSLSSIDQTQGPDKIGFTLSPLEEKGSLEFVPPTSIFAKLHVFRESGILDLIVRKETRTIYFKNGDIIYAETMSRKDDIADYLAKNRAGAGSGKELVAARAQAGGPKSDPNVYASILKESKLIEPVDFAWWLRLYQVDMIASLFIKPNGVYQWQSLDIPEYASRTSLEPFSTPRIIFQGIRVMKDKWNYRELLPDFKSIPSLAPDFYTRGEEYGLSAREIAILKVVNGKRNLKTIGNLCHMVAPNIENYLYACQQLQLIAFDIGDEEQNSSSIDLNAQLDLSDDEPDDQPSAIARDIINDTGDSLIQPQQSKTHTASSPIVQDTSPPPVFEQTVIKFSLTEGSLQETSILETFRQCIINSFTGQLKFQKQEIEKNVFWKRGKIITADSTDIDERLDNFLFRKELITADQRDQLRGITSEFTASPNELIKRKLLTIDKVFVIVKEQIESIVADLLLWREGEYHCLPDAKTPAGMVPLDLSAPAIIMTAFQKSTFSSKWFDQCAHESDFYRKLNRADNLRGIRLTTLERRIINILQEPVSVENIVKQVPNPNGDILISLLALEFSGTIERCSVK